jgi:hypothetical protein
LQQSQDSAQQFVDDILAGLTDTIIQDKHGIYGPKYYVYKAAAKDFIRRQKRSVATVKRKVNGRQFLKDIRDNMDEDSLMVKYRLTPRQLQTLFRQLISGGHATPQELSGRLKITKSQVTEALAEVGKAIRELD